MSHALNAAPKFTTASSNLAHLTHATDEACRKSIMDALGDKMIEPCGYNVLLATYIRPTELALAGGKTLHISDTMQEEDVWQGKVHLVLAVGADSYTSDEIRKFKKPYCKVGDWVVIAPTEGLKLQIGKAQCKLCPDDRILAVLPSVHGIL